MAKAPCARLTKPISPMVTDSPTDTMNRTMPAATPPSSKLQTSMPKITPAMRHAAARHRARRVMNVVVGRRRTVRRDERRAVVAGAELHADRSEFLAHGCKMHADEPPRCGAFRGVVLHLGWHRHGDEV